MRIKRHAMFAVILTVSATACGSDDATESTDTVTPGAVTTEAPSDSDPDVTSTPTASGGLSLVATDLGDIVVDDSGFTIYSFQPDLQGESTCYDQCEATWPVVNEVSAVGDGLDASLLGTTTRTDGSVQATYNDWPLYYFANDSSAGDRNGQGSGAAWYVLDAAGDPVIG